MARINRTQTKTDNQHLADKVGLRVNHLPAKKTIAVLDCFAGNGRIWRAVKRRTNKDIRVLAMDKKDIGFALPGDNLAWLKSIDLGMFDMPIQTESVIYLLQDILFVYRDM